jgi:hypothetical protein
MRTAGGQSAWKCTDVPVGHGVGLQDQVARLRSVGHRFAPHQLECAALGVAGRRLHADVRGPHKQPMREWVSRLPDDLVIAIHLDGFEPVGRTNPIVTLPRAWGNAKQATHSARRRDSLPASGETRLIEFMRPTGSSVRSAHAGVGTARSLES